MKLTFIATTLLASQFVLAAPIDSFIGRYELKSQKTVKGEAFCFQGIIVSEDRENVSLFRSDVTAAPMFKAPLNDPRGRETRGSHGEGLSSSKGLDTVMLKNGVLTFANKTKVKMLGLPAGTESDIYALKLGRNGELLAQRTTDESFGSKGQINCVYSKEK